jgi:hypothetical protein
MASVIYTSLSTLQPIELKYDFFKDEKIKSSRVSFKDGYTVFQNSGLKNYQDVTINRETTFVLTSAIGLDQLFTSFENYSVGKLPSSFYFQPRSTTLTRAAYNPTTNSIVLSSTGTPFYLSPVPNTNEVELIVNNRYIQVEEKYPFRVTTSIRSLPLVDIQRQRFECTFINSTITFKTKTKEGFRYLAFLNDSILRAVGMNFNNSVVNDYIFRYIPVTTNQLNINSELTNSWVTYFLSFEQERENKTVTLNKQYTLPTNLLIDFTVDNATKTGVANINIANLKTGVTPFGGPAPINNTTT